MPAVSLMYRKCLLCEVGGLGSRERDHDWHGQWKILTRCYLYEAQSVTFLYRALSARAEGTAEFRDVPKNAYYADAVAWAAANGITTGIGGGLFGPDNDCTRAQIVTFLFRTYNK